MISYYCAALVILNPSKSIHSILNVVYFSLFSGCLSFWGNYYSLEVMSLVIVELALSHPGVIIGRQVRAF